MTQYKFDVVVVGGGPAGVTAAGALGGSGLSVALLEAGMYAGAENWSGCVYFAENLANSDCFGFEAVESAPFERRVVRRGMLLHNGLDIVGMELTNPDIFKNCYTVLRPIYDPYFANLARLKGVVHVCETTVTSLMRKGKRVIGVQTNRGPLYADIVFIAEGDASHLVCSEQLERVPEPHYFQGVKAVLSLKPQDIERRFGLDPGDGCAFELLIRNPSIGGRTARLNIGGFLYTNRESLSLGYVIPLENLKTRYRGDHDKLFEWIRNLPYIKELTEESILSAYGTKIIRSGGWSERPILVEDGLAVGGASAGLGVDLPFPNFTGPASATGLYFARAAKAILRGGHAPDKRHLVKEYLTPLQTSVYGKNAQYLSKWPNYFGRSGTLFGRTVDIICGSAHFLSGKQYFHTGRFLRNHILSFQSIKESIQDIKHLIGALRLWKPAILTTISPITFGHWIVNLAQKVPAADIKFRIILRIGGKIMDAPTLPWPVGPLLKRMSPIIHQALNHIYSNDQRSVEEKFTKGISIVVRGMKLTDLVLLPVFSIAFLMIALAATIWDAYRVYVRRTPIEKLLAEPVMAYKESLRHARDVDAIMSSVSLEAKLATNTYHEGSASHIRTLWPDLIPSQNDMSTAALWWVCPARVYVYNVPLTGRGKVTVNYENCIKCESCWRAEPARVLWGRHTDHKLIFRPQSGTMTGLLTALRTDRQPTPRTLPRKIEDNLWYLSDALHDVCSAVLHASTAFKEAIARLPISIDAGRRAWPLALGRRLADKLLELETALLNDGRPVQAQLVTIDRESINQRLQEGRLFHALYCCRKLDQMITLWIGQLKGNHQVMLPSPRSESSTALSYEAISALFPDRTVKQWEDEPMPEAWAETLRNFIGQHRHAPNETIRLLSFISPALGLIAAHHLAAIAILEKAGLERAANVCAVAADHLQIVEGMENIRILGVLHLIPLSACNMLLVLADGKGHLIPLSTPGIIITPAPSIGFRAARLSDITLNCNVKKYTISAPRKKSIPDASSYLTIALGAADYLYKRVLEHAASRTQFPGQMLDTEGRDGIAKFGAVKSMISRTVAWQHLLETLYKTFCLPERHTSHTSQQSDLLCAATAAIAFSPEVGSIGYDAGQVFGGFAYSEDDLLSRFYRDSALFRFLDPGFGAAASLHRMLTSRDVDKAFPSLDRLRRIQGEPLGDLIQRLTAILGLRTILPLNSDPTLAGQAEALITGICFLFINIDDRLASGVSMESETASAEVLLDLVEDAFFKARLSAGRGEVSPQASFPIEPLDHAIKLDGDYETFCIAPGAPHISGSFLTNAFDRSPRFVPEIQLHDLHLRNRWTELADWFKRNCRDRKFDDLSIERAIEKGHHLQDEIIASVKQHKWLATYIPKSEDGLGWRKAEYYILNAAAGSFGDASINLLIMASTSIGTTPILLGLANELPRVQKELTPLVQDEVRLGEIRSRLALIIKSFANPKPAWIRKEYEALMRIVNERIRNTRVVKYLAGNFLRSFYGAGIAGQRGDLSGFIMNLKHAAALFERIMPDVKIALNELPRRERCHKLFLRYLGHGGVSAFALTEPTAGSDSGGVKTTAKLLSTKLIPLADGRYAFRLHENDETSIRYIIDADRLAFTDQGIAYTDPNGNRTPIMYDRYDYTTDQGVRYYVFQNNACEFHDIGQVRISDAGPFYEYYNLMGAKMWITNGSIATQFCLFAQTDEGVTGFLVDRHSEGLKVGADEKKMGQRGSPTNELSIDNVRVPREAVIGYEGHGQVNALETLNVGRCGLAVVSSALMHKLLDEAKLNIAPSPERDMLLGEAAAIMFGSESLAFYLIGLFDRPHESVRMESAIAKYVCSEDIHELLTIVEHAFGPDGQTEKFLLEKARRDARILTIYEGTNEVQRFLILRDLVSLAAKWPELAASSGDEHAQILVHWKTRLRNHIMDVASRLGDASWSDAMLQPAFFPLAEMAGEILRLECVFFRMEWLDQKRTLLAQSNREYVPSLLKAGQRAAERTKARIDHIHARFERVWGQVKENFDLAEVRAADSTLDAMSSPVVTEPAAITPLQTELKILCIVRPIADLSPLPRLVDGAVAEIVEIGNTLDLAGVVQSLTIKAQSNAKISVEVLLAGDPWHEQMLRSSAAGADRLIRLNSQQATPSSIAETVRNLEITTQYDVITIGSACLNGEQGTGAYLAGILSRAHYRKARLNIQRDGKGLEHIVTPAIISISDAANPGTRSLSDFVDATFSDILVYQPNDRSLSRHITFEHPSVSAAPDKKITSVQDVSEYLKQYAYQARSVQSEDYRSAISTGTIAVTNEVLTLLEPQEQKASAAVLRAGRKMANILAKPLVSVIFAPRVQWSSLSGMARANGANRAYCLDTGRGALSIDGKREMLRLITENCTELMILAGASWLDAFGLLAGETASSGKHAMIYGNIDSIMREGNKTVILSSSAYDGKLIRREQLLSDLAFITISQDAEFEAAASQSNFIATSFEFTVREEWQMPLQPLEKPTLSRAEVIIDLGYGIKDQTGLDLAKTLKKQLEVMGLAPMFGATRKVTQDLKLLPIEAQIGQTGVRVNPKLIIALGVSGAPQHIDYVGTRTEIICLNKDTEAPLIKLNQTRSTPRVHPVVGDLFATVKELIEKLM